MSYGSKHRKNFLNSLTEKIEKTKHKTQKTEPQTSNSEFTMAARQGLFGLDMKCLSQQCLPHDVPSASSAGRWDSREITRSRGFGLYQWIDPPRIYNLMAMLKGSGNFKQWDLGRGSGPLKICQKTFSCFRDHALCLSTSWLLWGRQPPWAEGRRLRNCELKQIISV